MLWLAGALLAQAGTEECEHFGEVSPPEAELEFGGPAVVFEVVDAGACGDAEGCAWRVDGDLGTVEPSSGSPVDYTPPAAPRSCIDTTLQLRVKCPGTAGSAIVTLRCAREPAPGDDGGGCGSSGAALALLPLAFARRESPVRVHRDLSPHR